MCEFHFFPKKLNTSTFIQKLIGLMALGLSVLCIVTFQINKREFYMCRSFALVINVQILTCNLVDTRKSDMYITFSRLPET